MRIHCRRYNTYKSIHYEKWKSRDKANTDQGVVRVPALINTTFRASVSLLHCKGYLYSSKNSDPFVLVDLSVHKAPYRVADSAWISVTMRVVGHAFRHLSSLYLHQTNNLWRLIVRLHRWNCATMHNNMHHPYYDPNYQSCGRSEPNRRNLLYCQFADIMYDYNRDISCVYHPFVPIESRWEARILFDYSSPFDDQTMTHVWMMRIHSRSMVIRLLQLNKS